MIAIIPLFWAGYTPLGSGLENKVIIPYVITPARNNFLKKPVLVRTYSHPAYMGKMCCRILLPVLLFLIIFFPHGDKLFVLARLHVYEAWLIFWCTKIVLTMIDQIFASHAWLYNHRIQSCMRECKISSWVWTLWSILVTTCLCVNWRRTISISRHFYRDSDPFFPLTKSWNLMSKKLILMPKFEANCCS